MKSFLRLMAGLLVLGMAGAGNLHAAEDISVVTTTRVLEDLVHKVAGSGAVVYSVAPPSRDLHFVSPTPKAVLKVKKADVFIHHGLSAEPWRLPLLNAAGRGDFLDGTRAIDASQGIPLQEIPVSLSRLEGDIHAGGNPHYWTDPENAKIMAATVAEGLARLYPDRAEVFRKNAEVFQNQVDRRLEEWQARLAPFRGSQVVTYHRSWPYFLKRFGFETLGEIEPNPGIPTTSRHLAGLIRAMKESGAGVVIKQPFHESRSPDRLAAETGARVAELVQFPGAVKEAGDYVSMMEYNIGRLERALRGDEA